MHTICALSTPYGRSAIALIRISGPDARAIIAEMTGHEPIHRNSIPSSLRSRSGELLDEVVSTFFQGPNSYTGEDVVEIACHGNPKIVEGLLNEIVSRGTRLAEPGEFTRRALASGKLTIDQVEALDVVLNATTLTGARMGLRAKTDGLGKAVSEISERLLELRVQVESQLDFSEAEVGAYDPKEILRAIFALESKLRAWTLSYESHRHLFGRWVVALVGKPNSGKSSLFNALIGDSKAIVYDQPGTTRDYLTHELEIEGAAVTLIDTAGIREKPDTVEGLGIAKTFEIMGQAEVICWVDEDGLPPADQLKSNFSEKRWVLVGSKADLFKKQLHGPIAVSSKAGTGLSDLRLAIIPSSVGDGVELDWAPLTSKRQYHQVQDGIKHLIVARQTLNSGHRLDMVAHEVGLAAESINSLVDRVPPEGVIQSIFARFCIGK